jgi:hypothetical protein
MADPPFEIGADHVSATCEFPGVPDTPDEAPGVVRGVTELDVLVDPVPLEFTALTRNVCPTPFTSPVIVADVEVDSPSANVIHS